MRSAPLNGPYSRTISAARTGASAFVLVALLLLLVIVLLLAVRW
jgi:hypothetical protein